MSQGVVAAGHTVTAEAAAEILRQGGNAFDAVIGGFFAACVAEPVLTSVGGGGYLNARRHDGHHLVYDFFVHTPRQRVDDCDFTPVIADFGTQQQEFHIGLGAAAVPGAVRGLFAVHEDLGRMPMRDIVAPAIAAARNGVAVTPFQAYLFTVVAPIYTATPEARALFTACGAGERPVGADDVLRAEAYADLLDALAHEGDGLFYRGEIAAAIEAQCEQGGGHLRRADLEHYAVERRKPLELDFRDARIVLTPPPSSGGLLVAFGLELLRDLTLPQDEHARHVLLAEVMNQTQLARVEQAAGGAEPSVARLLDPALLARYRAAVQGRAKALRGTTHISVMDSRGNAAAMTVSNGEGCGHIVPGGGFMLNNMLGEEDLHPQGFHRWTRNQRLTSMMCPSLVFHADGRLTALGSGGSNRIRTALLQVLVRLLDAGAPLQEAVSAPRVHFENGRLQIEGGHPEASIASLRQHYPDHHLWDAPNMFFGGVHAVSGREGRLTAAGDPRRDGVVRVA